MLPFLATQRRMPAGVFFSSILTDTVNQTDDLSAGRRHKAADSPVATYWSMAGKRRRILSVTANRCFHSTIRQSVTRIHTYNSKRYLASQHISRSKRGIGVPRVDCWHRYAATR